MTIEIRPAAVRAQLAQKTALLNAIGNAASDAYEKVDWFCGTGGVLTGEGYEAARVHMGQYKNFCLKVHECVEMTREADLKVGGRAGSLRRSLCRKRKRVAGEETFCRAAGGALPERGEPLGGSAALSRVVLGRGVRQVLRVQLGQAGRVRFEDAFRYLLLLRRDQRSVRGRHGEADGCGTGGRLGVRLVQLRRVYWEMGRDRLLLDKRRDRGNSRKEHGQAPAQRLRRGRPRADHRPVADSVGKWWEDISTSAANWWSENGTTVKNVGKAVFGVVGVVAGVAMIFTGIGAPAGAAAIGYVVAGSFGVAYGILDVRTGAAGFLDGTEHDWESDFARGAANAAGADEDAVEAGVKGFGTFVSLINVAKLPANAGRLLNPAGELADLAKSTKSVESAVEGFGSVGSKLVDAAEIGKTEKAKEVAKDALDLAEDLKDPFDLATSAADGLTAAKNKEMKYDAYRTNAAPGYGY